MKPKKQFTEEDIEEIKTKKLGIKCPFCNQYITGTKKSQVLYNMKTHMEAKHEED